MCCELTASSLRAPSYPAHDPPLFEVVDDHHHRLLRRCGRRVDREFRFRGRLVRVVDASEILELPGTGFLIKPLRVALLTRLDGRVEVNLDERQLPGGVQGP